jgi:hypothetical protein
LIYESQDIATTFQRFNAGYQELSSKGLPRELSTQQMVVNTPAGKIFAVGFTWSSEDDKAGRQWLTQFEGLGTVLMNDVKVTTVPDWMKTMDKLVARTAYGSSRTHSFRQLTSEVTAILGSRLEKMPIDPGTMFVTHELRGPSASPNDTSVFGTREPHFVLEILGISVVEQNRESGLNWAIDTWKALLETDPQNLLPGIYISLDPPGLESDQTPLTKIFGENAQEVISLKEQYDGQNVFDLAVPSLSQYSH